MVTSQQFRAQHQVLAQLPIWTKHLAHPTKTKEGYAIHSDCCFVGEPKERWSRSSICTMATPGLSLSWQQLQELGRQQQSEMLLSQSAPELRLQEIKYLCNRYGISHQARDLGNPLQAFQLQDAPPQISWAIDLKHKALVAYQPSSDDLGAG